MGVIAQELQKTFPEAVKLDKRTNALQIDQSQLGCDLVVILSALNGAVPPTKCGTIVTVEKVIRAGRK